MRKTIKQLEQELDSIILSKNKTIDSLHVAKCALESQLTKQTNDRLELMAQMQQEIAYLRALVSSTFSTPHKTTDHDGRMQEFFANPIEDTTYRRIGGQRGF